MQRMTATALDQPRPAYRLLVWLIEGCAQIPRCQGTALRFFDTRLLAGCTRCGQGKERLAHQIGSLLCRRCARIQLWHHLVAEHGG
ncbi:MAG TPA: hypothetical protein VGD58_11405 [Herpetosiphonaceae bacterium]